MIPLKSLCKRFWKKMSIILFLNYYSFKVYFYCYILSKLDIKITDLLKVSLERLSNQYGVDFKIIYFIVVA